MKTSLGEKIESEILAELDPIIRKFAKKYKKDAGQIKRAIAYLWEDAQRESEREARNYLSANEIGPFGGR